MKIYRGLSQLPPDFGPTVATIGNFDGVHRGHKWVIAEVIARAKAFSGRSASPSEKESVILSEASRGLMRDAESKDLRFVSAGAKVTSLAITLHPHPARFLRPENSTLALITPLDEKLDLLAATGIDATLVLPFDHALSRMTAREFAATVLRDAVGAIEVHEGENFRFGHNAEAGTDGLAELGRELGFVVKSYAPRALRGAPVSSSRIRSLISSGDVSHARALLGGPFTVLSTPASGRGYGTKYTVPTINLAPYAELLPANGVYITAMTIGEGDSQETFDAVTNVGNRPTFGADSFTVESHLLNFHPLALDESTTIRLAFLKLLRPEMRWPNPEALRAQIGRDVARAQRYFTLCRALRAKYATAPALPPAAQPS